MTAGLPGAHRRPRAELNPALAHAVRGAIDRALQGTFVRRGVPGGGWRWDAREGPLVQRVSLVPAPAFPDGRTKVLVRTSIVVPAAHRLVSDLPPASHWRGTVGAWLHPAGSSDGPALHVDDPDRGTWRRWRSSNGMAVEQFEAAVHQWLVEQGAPFLRDLRSPSHLLAYLQGPSPAHELGSACEEVRAVLRYLSGDWPAARADLLELADRVQQDDPHRGRSARLVVRRVDDARPGRPHLRR